MSRPQALSSDPRPARPPRADADDRHDRSRAAHRACTSPTRAASRPRRSPTRIAALPKVDAVYASPLERTRETAAPIAKERGLRVQVEKGLLECDFGEWTGQELKTLIKLPEWQTVQRYPSGFRFPERRVVRRDADAHHRHDRQARRRHKGGVIVAVSHADPIKAAVARRARHPPRSVPADRRSRRARSPRSRTAPAARWCSRSTRRTAPLGDMKVELMSESFDLARRRCVHRRHHRPARPAHLLPAGARAATRRRPGRSRSSRSPRWPSTCAAARRPPAPGDFRSSTRSQLVEPVEARVDGRRARASPTTTTNDRILVVGRGARRDRRGGEPGAGRRSGDGAPVRDHPWPGARVRRAAERLIDGGRPPCPLCGRPLNPDGHVCPRKTATECTDRDGRDWPPADPLTLLTGRGRRQGPHAVELERHVPRRALPRR